MSNHPSQFLRRLARQFQQSPATARQSNSRRARLTIQSLEDRTVPATFLVTDPGDTGAGTLREAIDLANTDGDDSVIEFDSGVFSTQQTISLLSALAQIAGDGALTINGPGKDLLTVERNSGAGNFRVFDSAGGDLTMRDFTVSNGFADTSNGGGLLASGFVTLDGMVFSGNSATGNDFNEGSGAGIAFRGGLNYLHLKNSTVTGNTTQRNGAAVYFYNNGSFLIENSTITGNTCTDSANAYTGGAIYFFGTAAYAPPAGFTPGALTIRNSTIEGNEAASVGGAIDLFVLFGQMDIQNSTISGNTAVNGAGGGINAYYLFGNINLQNSIVSDNTAGSAPDIYTYAGSGGAVIATNSAVGDTSGSNFVDNGGNLIGQALLLGPLADNGGPTQTMLPGPGSPLIDAGSNDLLPFGVAFDQRGTFNVRYYDDFVDMGAVELVPDGLPSALGIAANVGKEQEGDTTYSFQVIFADTTGINQGIDVSSVLNNNAAVLVTGPGGFNQFATFVSLDDGSNGTPRTATYSLTLPGGDWGPGGADNGEYSLTLQDSQVFDLDGNQVAGGPIGGFIVDIGETFIVTNNADSGLGSLRDAIDQANANAGLDYIEFDSTAFATPQLITLASALPLITDSVRMTGPGVDNVTVSGDNQFQVFSSVAPVLTITDMTVSGGSASGGGGLQASGNVTLDRMVFDSNTSVNSGGAVWMDFSSSLTLRNSTVSGNTTGRNGGGVYFFSGGSLLIENSTISGNSTTYSGSYAQYYGGGGVYFFGTAGALVVRNSTIANNTTPGTGGGVALRAFTGQLVVQNSTITGNNSDTTATDFGGGGIGRINGAGTIRIVNSVVSDNTNANAPDISQPAEEVRINYSAIGSLSGFTEAGTNGNNIVGVPLLLGPLQDNGGFTQTMAPQPGSPLIDAGSDALVPAALTTDQLGTTRSRIFGPAVDIGSYEVQTPGVTVEQGANQNDPTNLSPILFDVTFNANVTGFDETDIDFTGSTVGGTLAATVTGGGQNYVVSVTGMTGEGNVVVSVPAGVAIDSAQQTNSASTSVDNVVKFDTIGPAVTINQGSTQSDPTNAPVVFDVVFNEDAIGFDASDIDLSASTVGGLLLPIVTPITASTYTVTVLVLGINLNGQVIASIPAGAATDVLGNVSQSSTSTDNSVTFENIAPNVTIEAVDGDPDHLVGGTSVQFNVVFDEAVTGFDGSDIDFTGSTATGTLSAAVSGSGTNYVVTVTGMTAGGIVKASIPAGAANDLAGNGNLASTSLDNEVSYVRSGTLQFSAPTYVETEQNGPAAVITVTRVNGDEGSLTVDYASTGDTATNGLDYNDASGQLSWVNGETASKTFTVQILDDSDIEGSETVNLALTNVPLVGALGTPNTAVLTITDYEEGTLAFNASTYAGSEPTGMAVVSVTRTDGSNGAVAVTYSTVAGGTALPVDFTATNGVLNWADGEAGTKTFTVVIADDSANEGLETIRLALANPTNGAELGLASAFVNIAPSDPKGSGTSFLDTDGDKVTVKLVQPATVLGTVGYYLNDPDGNGQGPIELIELTNTSSEKSTLNVTVVKKPTSTDSGTVAVGEVRGSGIKTLNLAKSKLDGNLGTGVGINLTGMTQVVRLNSIANGADVIAAGTIPKKTTKVLVTNAIGDNTTIQVDGPLSTLRATGIGNGNIVAASAGTITVTKKGDFMSDLTLSGAGIVAPKKALTMLNVTGDILGSNISVGGNVGTVKAVTFVNSRLFAGYTGPDDGTGTFTSAATVSSFTTSGLTDSFANSHAVATTFTNVVFKSVDSTNGGNQYGVIADTSLKLKVTTPAPAFNFDKNNPAPQTIGDFRVDVL